jgi:hypothetical protein
MPEPRPDPADVPEPLSRFLKQRPSGMWMPEVEARATGLAIADHYLMTDKQYLAWLKAQNRSFFASLMYRAVMSFVSPVAIVPKATARWAAVHRGSALTAEVIAPRDVQVTLTFPPHLFAGLALQQVAVVLEAILEHAKAPNAEVSLVEVSATRGVYRARWGA